MTSQRDCEQAKRADDHSVVTNGARVWTCSGCGARSRWSPGWTYFGTLGCKWCHTAHVDRVMCPGCTPVDAKFLD